jgi:sterol desaturase/sphingolipid hydroxylase (fatty acid hydroxylase superfamily)
MTMRDLAAAFAAWPAVRAYAVLALLSAAAAAMLAGSGDLPAMAAAAAAACLVYPVAWYLLHRFVLHGRWLYRHPATSGLWKRIHFDHHQDPHRLDVLFGALSTTLPTIGLVTVGVGWLIGGAPAAAAAFCAGLLTTIGYEFVHCVQHLGVQPRSAWLRRLKRLHLAHHFHDETGNFGIVSFAVDRLFGTYYDAPAERSRSAHVFDLGYDAAEAARYPWVADLSGGPPRSGPPRSGPARPQPVREGA